MTHSWNNTYSLDRGTVVCMHYSSQKMFFLCHPPTNMPWSSRPCVKRSESQSRFFCVFVFFDLAKFVFAVFFFAFVAFLELFLISVWISRLWKFPQVGFPKVRINLAYFLASYFFCHFGNFWGFFHFFLGQQIVYFSALPFVKGGKSFSALQQISAWRIFTFNLHFFVS